MQDRFKFRIFDKIYNRFFCTDKQKRIIFDYEDKKINVLENEENSCWLHIPFDECEILQCTGLKDKNGKLIYEKDIIRFYFDNDEIIAVVEWDNNECRFYLNTTDYFKDKYVTDYEIVKQEYEVIGNIYENAELLEE